MSCNVGRIVIFKSFIVIDLVIEEKSICEMYFYMYDGTQFHKLLSSELGLIGVHANYFCASTVQ